MYIIISLILSVTVMPDHYRKVQFSKRHPLSMDISEIADSIENGIPETFWTTYLAVFGKWVPKSQIIVLFGMLPPIKVLMTFVLCKSETSFRAWFEAN
jgi:hypothetical protein